jgi:hypothetical protein
MIVSFQRLEVVTLIACFRRRIPVEAAVSARPIQAPSCKRLMSRKRRFVSQPYGSGRCYIALHFSCPATTRSGYTPVPEKQDPILAEQRLIQIKP